MAFTGYYDAISLALSIKLMVLAIAAAFTDSWHAAFYHTKVGPNLTLIMALLFTGMLTAIANLLATCLAVFLTEGARTIASVMAGTCAFKYAAVLILFARNLVSLASPWILVMLNCSLAVLTAHLVLIRLAKLDDCPLCKLALASIMLLMSALSVSLRHWWIAGAAAGPTASVTCGLFSLPSGAWASIVQAFSMLTLVCLVLLVVLFGTAFAAKRTWISTDPFGDAVSAYLGIGLSAACWVCTLVAVVAYCTMTSYTNSLLAAVCMFDASLCLMYQLFSSATVTVA